MELNATSHVILGMLGLRPMCGYEIKNFVDNSTRFFWAASYGQIYPELGRLAEAGLIEGTPDPQSARRRIEFRLTPAGRERLEGWLAAPSQIQETRDESLLKVFFSSAGAPGTTRAALEAKRDHHRAVATELRAIQAAKVADEGGDSAATTLRFGIAIADFVAEWCDREAKASG